MSQQKSQLKRPLNESIKQSIEPRHQRLNPARASVNEVLSQSMLSVDDDLSKKQKKKYKKFIGCGCFWFILGLLLFLAFPSLLHYLAVKSATDQAILSPDTEKYWAHFPGDSGTVITRNYSFFNMTNEQGVLLYGQKPNFRQIEGYIITELQDYLNITYNDDYTKVSMTDWLRFDVHPDSRSLDEKVKVLNLGTIGYWYTLKNTRESVILLQGLSLLFSNIQSSIINIVLGQGVSSQYLSSWQNAQQLYSLCGVSKENSHFLWYDEAFGMSDQNNLQFWVDAAQSSYNDGKISFSMSAIQLKDYFTLSDSSLFLLLSEMYKYSSSVYDLIIQNHYCFDIQNCDGRQLAIRQMATSYVTGNTPPVSTITPTDTICTDNVTCNGKYPQLSSYFTNVYLKQHPQADPYLTFSEDTVRKWLDYNPSRRQGEYSKAEYALLHIGNLDALWENGTMYDNAKTEDQQNQYLKNIQNRFQTSNALQTKVFWSWLKYLVNEFIRAGNDGNQRLGIANTFTQGFYSSFAYLQDNLQIFLLKQMIKTQTKGKQCINFVKTSFQIFDDDSLVQSICDQYDHNIQSDEFLDDMVRSCKNKYQKQWQKLISLGVTLTETETLCDSDIAGGFGQLYDSYRKQLNSFYQCDKTPSSYCSDYELAIQQWSNSSVTLKQPQVVAYLQSSTTFASWDPSAKKFEYGYFKSKFPTKQFPVFTIDDGYQNMNFESWFSTTVIINIFSSPKTEQTIKDYIRFVAIFTGFNGFTNVRSARDLIFGYDDQFLLNIKNSYPPFGGDPSVQSNIAFNDPNITQSKANIKLEWHTGKENSSLVSQHSLINGKNYLTTNYTRFNGNETSTVLQSPWIGEDYFYGTSGKQFSPNQEQSKNISVYIPNLQRYGSGNSENATQTERYGYSLMMSNIGQSIYQSSTQNIDNRKYYQTYHAVFNETSVTGFPFFISKHRFMNASKNWTTFVDVYNEDGSIQYKEGSHWDDSYVIVQPYSGVSFQSTLYLQSNYHYEPDQLYKYNQTSLLPVFALYRSGNLTQTQANNLFSPLKAVIIVQGIMFYIGIIFSIGGILLTGFGYTKMKQIKQERNITEQDKQAENKKTKMKISLQKMDAQEKVQEKFESKPMVKDKQEEEEELKERPDSSYLQPLQKKQEKPKLDQPKIQEKKEEKKSDSEEQSQQQKLQEPIHQLKEEDEEKKEDQKPKQQND